MRYFFWLFFTLFLPVYLLSQKHDYIWAGGENGNSPILGGFNIDFNQSPAQVHEIDRPYNMFFATSSISDSSGQLVAYTDGCRIISGVTDSVMINGEKINPGYVNDFQCDSADGIGSYGNWIQSSLFLPWPERAGGYVLVHKRVIYTYNPFDVVTNTLFYSIINANMGEGGTVTHKNLVVKEERLAFGMMTAVKHANEKDWWIITPREKEDEIYSFLLTRSGILPVNTVLNQIGFNLPDGQETSCQVTFTPDGTKMITSNPYTGIGIFDFDRSTGVLSNYRSFPIANMWPGADFVGCAVSPNSRYLYISAIFDLFQYDLQAEDVEASQVLLGTWDGTFDPLPTGFAMLHLAPDCKIYMQTSQQAKTLHIIHNPDEAGTACNFEQRGFPLPRNNRGGLPLFPNFRLGSVEQPGVPCTGVSASTQPPTPLPEVSVFPNPANDYLKIIPNRYFEEAGSIRLYAADGRLVFQKTLDLSAQSTQLAIHTLNPGLYWYEVRTSERIVRSGKLWVRE